MRARPIKFTRNYGAFKASGQFGESLELCTSILNDVVKLPPRTKTIYVVPLKRATKDTIKIEHTDDSPGGYYLLVEGNKTEFVWETARFINTKYLYQGIQYFRIEY